MKLKPIENQVVVVMGASSGIGRETALRFASNGANVVVSARSEEGLCSLDECCVVVGMGSSSRRKGQARMGSGPPIPGCSRTRAARVPGRAPSAR